MSHAPSSPPSWGTRLGMPRHYKLSTGSTSSLCERYDGDWVSLGLQKKASHEAFEGPDAVNSREALLDEMSIGDGCTGGTGSAGGTVIGMSAPEAMAAPGGADTQQQLALALDELPQLQQQQRQQQQQSQYSSQQHLLQRSFLGQPEELSRRHVASLGNTPLDTPRSRHGAGPDGTYAPSVSPSSVASTIRPPLPKSFQPPTSAPTPLRNGSNPSWWGSTPNWQDTGSADGARHSP